MYINHVNTKIEFPKKRDTFIHFIHVFHTGNTNLIMLFECHCVKSLPNICFCIINSPHFVSCQIIPMLVVYSKTYFLINFKSVRTTFCRRHISHIRCKLPPLPWLHPWSSAPFSHYCRRLFPRLNQCLFIRKNLVFSNSMTIMSYSAMFVYTHVYVQMCQPLVHLV